MRTLFRFLVRLPVGEYARSIGPLVHLRRGNPSLNALKVSIDQIADGCLVLRLGIKKMPKRAASDQGRIEILTCGNGQTPEIVSPSYSTPPASLTNRKLELLVMRSMLARANPRVEGI